MLDSPEVRRAVLNQLIDERVVYGAALKSGMTVPNAELQSVIGDIPAFKDGNGNFSAAALQGAAARAGNERRRVRGRPAQGPRSSAARARAFAGTAFMPNTVIDRLYRLRQQKREVSQYVLDPSQFTAKVKVTPEEVQAYYDGAQDRVRAAGEGQAGVRRFCPSRRSQKQLTVTPEELQEFYKARAEQLGKPEERRASHILIAVPASATPEQKAKAKEKAEALLAQAKKVSQGLCRARQEEFGRSRLRAPKAVTSASSPAARWSSRSTRRCSA